MSVCLSVLILPHTAVNAHHSTQPDLTRPKGLSSKTRCSHVGQRSGFLTMHLVPSLTSICYEPGVAPRPGEGMSEP